MQHPPIYHASFIFWKEPLERGLIEDGAQWDWTSLGIGSLQNGEISAEIIAKETGIWAAQGLMDAVNRVALERGMNLRAESVVADGARVEKGQVVSRWVGAPQAVLAFERPALNLAGFACGIATKTNRFVEKIRALHLDPEPRITLTRKTLPGYRDLCIHAVRVGGGAPHRVALSGGVLIKENHIAAAGGIAKAIYAARNTAPHGLRIEIEVRSLAELNQALAEKVEIVMLDNFTPDLVREALKTISSTVIVEISGGITEETLEMYAQKGVSVISVGGLTHSARALDLSLLMKGAR